MTQPITAIHQFHHGVDAGDGVTNSLLFIQRLLREVGVESDIYAANIPATMADCVRPYRELESCDPASSLLLHHHSMGHELGEWLNRLAVPRALVYHNITPAGFFPPGSDLHRYAERGREQLVKWRDEFRAVLAVSDFNAEDLVALGYEREAITTIPLLVDLDRPAADAGTLPDPATRLHPGLSERPVLLFVGRIVENKRQHLLIEALWHLQRMQAQHGGGPPAMLVMVGGGETSDYARFLRQRLHQLHLDDSVIMPGKVDDLLLQALYRHSAAFVCASAHEGFGMPLVEAMLADCPVVAMGLTNIPYTLGEGGLVLDSEDPAVMAASLSLLLEDKSLRDEVLAGQQRSLLRYRPEVLASALRDWLTGSLGLTLPDGTSTMQ
ncbi:MAG: glycosyltransferase family 4 protein [Halomonas sp.]|uniref:glycosyltransferase family 4 protein n=1 Tax=Halomonas sp. TaxID=1486246 RepID=UPI0028705EA3|nr:glycosyltransferase family 4 protein [Halomonas sp.]MDR9440697.1 glycosyltransferase family 4 protein [Halomonas sp.]